MVNIPALPSSLCGHFPLSAAAQGLIANTAEAAVSPSREQFNGPNHFIVTRSKNIHCVQSVLISATHLLTRSSLTACPANSMPRFVTAATSVYMTGRSGTSGLRDHCYHERHRLDHEDSRSSGFPYLLPLATVCFPYLFIFFRPSTMNTVQIFEIIFLGLWNWI